MKKTFSLSISGRIFQVEEDAYALLLDYLDSLAQIFRGNDAQEIVDDIEARISDIFQEQVEAGKIVFTIADAENVIAIIGNAAQIASECEDTTISQELHDDSAQNKANTQNAGTQEGQSAYTTTVPRGLEIKRKLFRSNTDKVLGGVLGGLAIRFGVNALPLRIIMVLLMFPVGFFPLFLVYCVAWAIIPLANTPERILEQEGRPVTVANIGEVLSMQGGRTVLPSNGNSFLQVLGALLMGFLALIAGVIGVGMLIAVFVLFTCMFGVLFGTAIPFGINVPFGVEEVGAFGALANTGQISLAFFAGACICLAVLIPCIAMIWAACSVLFKVKGASRTVWITALIVEAIAIIAPAIILWLI